MTLDQELELARKATPGPWFRDGFEVVTETSVILSSEHCLFDEDICDRNAVFSAHFNPARVIELLEELKRLRDALSFYAKSTGYPSDMDRDNGDLARDVLGLKIHWEIKK